MTFHSKHIPNSHNLPLTCMYCNTNLTEFLFKADTCQNSSCYDCTVHILTCETENFTETVQMYDNNMKSLQSFSKSQFLSLNIAQIFYDDLYERKTSRLQNYDWSLNRLEMRVKNLMLEIKVLTEDFHRNRKVLTCENFGFFEQLKVKANKNKETLEKYKEEMELVKTNLINEMENVAFYSLIKEERFQEMVKSLYQHWLNLIGRSICIAMTIVEITDKCYKLMIECDRVLHE